MDELMGDFIAETREMLDAIAGEIVAWEANPADRAKLDAIFRFVHTVKGSCGFLDLPRLARLSHAAEDALAEVRAGRRTPDAALVSAVLGVVDRIGELAQAIASGESLPHAEDQRLIAALQAQAPAEPPPVTIAANVPRGQPRTIRLPIELLDRIMSGVSDVVLARNELALRLREACHDADVADALDRLSASVAEMREAITRTRMQRIDHLFASLPRMVRDLSAELGRAVVLEVEGGEVELDREMIELIRDPLTHIIRNAIDHGIEPAEVRRAAGKPAAGSLRIGARQSGNQIVIEASDDGRGIDGDRLAARAVEAGLIPAGQAAALPWAGKLALIFEPGLSTAHAVTAISGRGVGMDVVRANVERIGGVVDVESRPGAGTRIQLRVPLTLTIIPALIVSAGGQRFAIPRMAVEEIVRLAPGAARIEAVGGRRLAYVRGKRMPLLDLSETLDLPHAEAPRLLVVLKPAGGGPFAVAVAGAHDHEELVVKPAAPAVMATGFYAGTTLPDSGRPMLLLDAAGLAEAAGTAAEEVAPIHAEELPATPPLLPTLLFRDLDGVRRAVRLSLVERIEEVPAAAVRFTAGRLRVSHNERVLPVTAVAPLPDRPRQRLLRMSDGDAAMAYAIDEVVDILPMGPLLSPAAVPGPVAGVLLAGDEQVELLDPHWLFADAGVAGMAGPPPLCLLGDSGDGWTRDFLAPLVEAAGYRVAFADRPPDEAPDLVIAADDSAPTTTEAPLVRLSADPAADGEDRVYRYDRAALVAALGRRTRRTAA